MTIVRVSHHDKSFELVMMTIVWTYLNKSEQTTVSLNHLSKSSEKKKNLLVSLEISMTFL